MEHWHRKQKLISCACAAHMAEYRTLKKETEYKRLKAIFAFIYTFFFFNAL